LVAVLAVVVIAGAGVAIFRSMSPPPMDAVSDAVAPVVQAPSPPPREEPVVDVAAHPGDVRTRLFVSREGKDGASMVSLGRAVGPPSLEAMTGTRPRLLERELVRQAVLIAARDELGLQTRDEVLDEVAPPAGEAEPIELSTYYGQTRGRIMIRKGEGEKAETLVAKELPPVPDGYDYPAEIAKIAESLSRTKFVEMLKQLGLAGEPNKVRAEAPPPADFEEKMSRLGIVDHFAAVRALHDAIRTDGESPERLEALARAYARLGALTCYQWSARSRIFQARAMLYAERLVARDPESIRPLWNRAFVRAVLGLHALALNDLRAAELRAEKAKSPAARPDWVDMIDVCARFDLARLKAVKGPSAPLAALLLMSALEYPGGSELFMDAGKAVVEAHPECARAIDALGVHGPINIEHQTTVLGIQSFDAHLPLRLKEVEDLPAAIRDALDDDDADGPALIAALDEAGRPSVDVGEPPWGGLAHLARDAYFSAVWRRLSFMKHTWGVPVDEFWLQVRHLVDDHRLRPFLEIVADPEDGIPAFLAMAEKFDASDLEMVELDLINAMRRLNVPGAESLWGVAIEHGSHLYRDLAWATEATSNEETGRKLPYARYLLAASPHAPFAMGVLVQYDWDRVQDRVDDWKAKAGDAPAFLDGLGAKYMELERYDEAADVLSRRVKRSPDFGAYTRLAACQLARGDRDQWRAVLDDYLNKTEDTGLGHARVRVEIAQWLMDQGRPAEAKEYAETAAETWAAWAMLRAAEVNEELKDWEGAELWYRRTSERYPNTSPGSWYRFCLRTGRGDLDEARAFVESMATGPNAIVSDFMFNGYFYVSIKEPRRALASFEEAYRAERLLYNGLQAMLAADELGDKTRRDEILTELCAEFESAEPLGTELCRFFRDFLAKGDDKAALDDAALNKILAASPADGRGSLEYLLGVFLRNRGRTDEALKYFRICAESRTSANWFRDIAASIVRSADGDSKPPTRGAKPKS